jgi:pilus assembly protein CpaB
MPRTGSSSIAELVRLLSWHRRKLAVLAAMGATAAGISAATPPSPPTVEVVVADRQLSGGRQLTDSDLTLRNLPASAVPRDAITDPAAVVGRTLVAPLTRGSVLTELSILGDRPTVADGSVIAPVRISDATVISLLRVGDRVDIVAADPESGKHARVIAQGVRVVTIPRSISGGGGLDPGGTDPQSLVLVEVSSDQAIDLAEAAAGSQLSLLLI